MSKTERAPFVDLALQDKNRFDEEKRQFDAQGFFIDKDGHNSHDLMIEKKKLNANVIKPKKVMTSFMYFVKTNLTLVR